MKIKKVYFIFSIVIVVISFKLSSCKKDKASINTDKELFEMAKNTSGFVWYKNTSSLLSKSHISGHSEAFLKTKFNSIAATMLDSLGKVIEGKKFPDGSLIVKELYSDNSTLSTYAILYKKAGHKNADADNWVWGYVRPSEEVREPSSNKGSACRSCHSQNGNIDFSLMNIAFP